MQRCKKCILTKNYSAVTFDEDGVCNLCNEYESTKTADQNIPKGTKDFSKLITEIKQREDRDYDCVVPLSGGQDSSYVAYCMVKEYGLRPIAINYDNGYRSDLAISNISAICDSLNIELITLRPPRTLMMRLFGHFFKNIGYFCTVCDAVGFLIVGSFMHREAKRLGYKPLVVGGWSKKYEFQPGLSVLSMNNFGHILKKDPTLWTDLKELSIIDNDVFDSFLAVDDIRQMSSTRENIDGASDVCTRFIQLPEYIDWEYKNMQTALNKIGWQRPAGKHEAHFDCLLHPLQEYLKNKKVGFSQQTIKNSVLIREGRMTREEALAQIALEQLDPPEILDQILNEWKISSSEIAWDAEWA